MSEKRDLRIFLTDILTAADKIIRYNQEKDILQNTNTEKDLEAIISFLFRHVPAMICRVCGEEYLSEEIQDGISDITNRCLDTGLSVNVYDFQIGPIKA